MISQFTSVNAIASIQQWLKFVLIHERESNRKNLPKMFADKNLKMTQKKGLRAGLIKKWSTVLSRL